MVAINFTVFIDKIRNGTKKQTIRKWNSERIKQMKKKKILQLYTGMRTKNCELLKEVELKEILQMIILPDKTLIFTLQIYDKTNHRWNILNSIEVDSIIKLDGFDNKYTFFNWFNKKYDLRTELFAIIRWN